MAAAERLTELFRSLPDDADPQLRAEVADAWIKAQAYRWQTYATAARLLNGGEMGSEASYMKVWWSELDVELHATALRLLGERGELASDWMSGYLFALSGPIYAGTNEVQRNIIAKLVLQL